MRPLILWHMLGGILCANMGGGGLSKWFSHTCDLRRFCACLSRLLRPGEEKIISESCSSLSVYFRFRESSKDEVENSREGKTNHKTPPPKRLWTLPPMIRFSPPLGCPRPVISLRGNGHRPDESHFLRPRGFRGHTLWSVPPPPPPPQNRMVRFVPPPLLAVSQSFRRFQFPVVVRFRCHPD